MPKIDAVTQDLRLPASAHTEAPLDYRATFARAARLLAASGDFLTTLEQTLGACLPVMGDFGFFDARDGGQVVRVARAYEDPRIEALLRPTRWALQLRTDMNLCALSMGEPALHPDVDDAWYRRVAANEGHLELMRELAFRSMITVPMRFRGELIGALTLFMGSSRRRHKAHHLELAEDIAALAAPVVANARLLDENRRATEALRASEERLRLAQMAAGLGAWDWNITTGEVYWSPQYREIYGLAPDQVPSFEAGMAALSLEDRERVADTMARALQAKTEFRALQRVEHPHKGPRWVEAIGKATYDARGLPVRVAGVVMDVTQRQEATEEMRGLRDQLGAELEALRRLHEVTLRTARRNESLGNLLGEILAAALDITGRDRGAIHLLEQQAGTLRLAVAKGFEPSFTQRIESVRAGDLLPSALALRRRERVVIEEVAVELASSPFLSTLLEAGVRSVQSTPLVSRAGDVVGTFTTHSGIPGRPGERELRLLDMLSRSAADLIEWAGALR